MPRQTDATMSSNYSANQYDDAFRPRRLRNWTLESQRVAKRPMARRGHTTFVADDRGHLHPGMRKAGSAWPDFKGTWDLPSRIPMHHINPMGRSVEGLSRLRSWGLVPQHTDKSVKTQTGPDCPVNQIPEGHNDPPAENTHTDEEERLQATSAPQSD